MSTGRITGNDGGAGLRRVIVGASLGTGFEWYDFFLYGSLAGVISKQFFTGLSTTLGFIFALLTFAAGFAVRPLGALIFGRLGDLLGRKRTFLITIIIMGSATTLVGVLPGYASIGLAAPVMLIVLRMLQGLAIGGEYGGACIYVAEHCPAEARGYYTSWIQTTATLALVASLLVILGCRAALGSTFDSWGWRIPFLLSTVLLAVSVYIRLHLPESPVFARLVAEGEQSKAPVRDAFGDWSNLKRILAVLVGATAGMNVIWYGAQLYSLYFLTQVLKVDPQQANLLLVIALVCGTPLYVLFGWLSDRLGRKRLVLTGMALAATTYFPLYHALTHYANPAIEHAASRAPVTVMAAPGDCGALFDPIGQTKTIRSCDIARSALATAGVPYRTVLRPGMATAVVHIGNRSGNVADISSYSAGAASGTQRVAEREAFIARLEQGLRAAGYPRRAEVGAINFPMVLLVLMILMTYATLVTAPMAAWLVELFPARIRYTSLSVPYHIGAGFFGGFLPAVAFTLVALTGDIYSGLWYPVIIVAVTLVAGVLFLPETAVALTRASHSPEVAS